MNMFTDHSSAGQPQQPFSFLTPSPVPFDVQFYPSSVSSDLPSLPPLMIPVTPSEPYIELTTRPVSISATTTRTEASPVTTPLTSPITRLSPTSTPRTPISIAPSTRASIRPTAAAGNANITHTTTTSSVFTTSNVMSKPTASTSYTVVHRGDTNMRTVAIGVSTACGLIVLTVCVFLFLYWRVTRHRVSPDLPSWKITSGLKLAQDKDYGASLPSGSIVWNENFRAT